MKTPEGSHSLMRFSWFRPKELIKHRCNGSRSFQIVSSTSFGYVETLGVLGLAPEERNLGKRRREVLRYPTLITKSSDCFLLGEFLSVGPPHLLQGFLY